jgi:CubicO group peptidase (beta-lactamase class C family)
VDASTQLDAALNDIVAEGVPGVLVRVKDANRAARRYAAGADDFSIGTALRPTARYRVGSITKTFVATIVLQLVGEGRIRLDDPDAKRLPGLLANGEQITARQLLNHTSGLPDYTADPELFAGIKRGPRMEAARADGPSREEPAAVRAWQRLEILQHQLHRRRSADRSGHRTLPSS